MVEEFEGGVVRYMADLMTRSDTTALVTPGDARFSHLIVENGLAARHPVLVIDGAEVAIVKPVVKEFGNYRATHRVALNGFGGADSVGAYRGMQSPKSAEDMLGCDGWFVAASRRSRCVHCAPILVPPLGQKNR